MNSVILRAERTEPNRRYLTQNTRLNISLKPVCTKTQDTYHVQLLLFPLLTAVSPAGYSFVDATGTNLKTKYLHVVKQRNTIYHYYRNSISILSLTCCVVSCNAHIYLYIYIHIYIYI